MCSAAQNRLASMLQGRDDWCISRQRVWGVPIPVFYELETDKPLLTSESIAHVQSKFIEHGGSDCWWSLPIEELLPPSHRGQAAKYRKGEDTMDVWFDSGSSWAHLKSRLGVNDPVSSRTFYFVFLKRVCRRFPPISTWRGRTSTEAGSSRRCSRASLTRVLRPTASL